jgi:hypothetical protein
MHFSGLVVGPDVDAQMARYDENLAVEPHIDACGWCDGDAKYQPCSTCNDTGKESTTRNPDGKWDYFRVGGRWRGLLYLLPGHGGDLAPQSYEWTYHEGDVDWTGRADTALAGDVDWDRTIAELGEHRTYFMLAEGAWKSKEEYDPSLPQRERFVQDPNFQALWDLTVRNLDPSVRVTIVDIHS